MAGESRLEKEAEDQSNVVETSEYIDSEMVIGKMKERRQKKTKLASKFNEDMRQLLKQLRKDLQTDMKAILWSLLQKKYWKKWRLTLNEERRLFNNAFELTYQQQTKTGVMENKLRVLRDKVEDQKIAIAVKTCI